MAQRRALLTAALGLMRLTWRGPAPPAVVMLAHWLNSWPGLGAVVFGMNAQGFNVELKEGSTSPDGNPLGRAWSAPSAVPQMRRSSIEETEGTSGQLVPEHHARRVDLGGILVPRPLPAVRGGSSHTRGEPTNRRAVER